MADFTHLKTSKIDNVEFTFYAVVGEPTLLVKFAGESNKPYFNEMLKVAEKHRMRRAKLSLETIKTLRERDRELFPKYVVTGWRGVKDANGADVAFSREECEGFLRALDDDMFDDLRKFCDDPSNFREEINVEAAAGNSQTA